MSFCKLLKLAVNTEAEEDVLSCARIGQKLGLLTNEVLKKQIFPDLHNWPELVVTSLEDVGVERKATVTPLIEWLIGQGKTEAASTLAGIFSEHVDSKLKFFTQTSKNVGAVCNHAHENTSLNAFRAKHTKDSPPGSSSQTISTSVQSSQDTTEGQCAESVNIVTLSQAELEEMLAARTTSPATRGQAYLRLLEIFHAAGAVDQAIQLAERLKMDGSLHLPEFHNMFGNLSMPSVPGESILIIGHLELSDQEKQKVDKAFQLLSRRMSIAFKLSGLEDQGEIISCINDFFCFLRFAFPL